MKKKTVIFDCDGVLREFSWQGVYFAYVSIARYFDCEMVFAESCPDIIAFRKKYSHDWRQNMIMMGIYGEERAKIADNIFKEEYFSQIDMFPWVPEIIGEIAKKHTVTVFTNSSEASVKRSLSGVNGYLSMILGHERIAKLKPSPDGIHFIMDKLRSDAKDTIMIGDSEADIMAGKNAGVQTALVTWGAVDTEEEISSLGANMVVRNPFELQDIF